MFEPFLAAENATLVNECVIEAPRVLNLDDVGPEVGAAFAEQVYGFIHREFAVSGFTRFSVLADSLEKTHI